MGLTLEYGEGQTPIDDDEREGLLIHTIANRRELDEFEQLNIEAAMEWTLKKKFSTESILTEYFVKELHKKMFGRTWNWAGKFRTSNKNLGVDKMLIREELKKLFDDCTYWIAYQIFPPDEIAVRFSHRIVSVHPFPNGNGRHSRLMADVLVAHGFDRPFFTWGSATLVQPGEARKRYLSALKDADGGNYGPLVLFARE
jgi:Fic-DOC domain mobile mystery protein B